MNGLMNIFIPGKPTTQGSGKALISKSTKRAVYVPTNGRDLRVFRKAVQEAVDKYALEHAHPAMPIEGPVNVYLKVWINRPKNHYRAGRFYPELRPNAPRIPVVRPDVDKIARACLDALTQAGVWNDDSQVADLGIEKRYVRALDSEGVVIHVEPKKETA